jgi:hypothetical protein
MTADSHASLSIEELSSRIRELLPDLSSSEHKDELVTQLDRLQQRQETSAASEYTVPTHLRRIFAILESIGSPAAKEANKLIENYAASAGISL